MISGFNKSKYERNINSIMMKKLLCMLCMVGTVAIVYAQEESSVGIVIAEQESCTAVPVSHWSFGIKTGVSKFMIPPDAPKESDRLKWMYGGVIDYTVNPFIGIGIEYDNNDYSRPYTYAGHTGEFKGGTHDFLLYGSLNISNALAPYRNGAWRNLNIYGDVGGGVSLNHYYEYYMINGVITDEGGDRIDKKARMGKLGLNAEITLTESLNFSLAGQYNQYYSRNMSGATSLRNCDALIFTMGLRLKLGTTYKKHARNINLCEYSPKPVPTIVNKNYVKGETPETLSRLKAIQDENAAMRLKVQKLEQDAKDAEKAAIQKRLATENLTLQQKLQKMEDDLKELSTKKDGVVNMSLENIEFKTGSNVLTASSSNILEQVAGILNSNTAWTKLTVAGHTDNVGSEVSNLKLSQARALSVKKYLVSKGVPTSKIVTSGWGETDPIVTNDTPEGRQKNRRVEFEIK